MKRLIMTAAALALLSTAASADSGYTAADIAKLPQDKVVAIRQQCASEWGDDFRMREYCEDKQFKALQSLIARGSVGSKGERL